jgi:serine acetyltransferase
MKAKRQPGDALRRIRERWTTLRLRQYFAAWGRSSRIGPGARLNSPHLIRVGAGVSVGECVWLNAKDDRGDGRPTMHIGDGTYIGRCCQINAWREVSIGKDVLIADRVFISDADHKYADASIPIKLQGDAFVGAVTLADGCWVGIGAVILPGVTIGRNAVVGANAVVVRSVPDHGVVGGSPARMLRDEAAKGQEIC